MSSWRTQIPVDRRESSHNALRLSRRSLALCLLGAVLVGGCVTPVPNDFAACTAMVASGMRPLADDRTERFLGKVADSTARCRGGERAAMFASEPWVDWQNY